MKFLIRYMPAGSQAIAEAVVDATSPEAARAGLGERGRVVSVRRAAGFLWPSPKTLDVSAWCRELGTLLRSGMTVVEALDVMCATASAGARRDLLLRLRQTLEQGVPLSRAMGAVGQFPAVLVASVAASERASTLEEALRDYLRHQVLIEQLQRRAVSAAVYPALVAIVGSIVVLFLLLFVLPRFSAMYVGSAAATSTATRLVLVLSGVVREHWWVVLSCIAALLLMGAEALRRGWLRSAWMGTVDALPWLRGQLDHFALAKLYQSLTMMVRGGYTVHEAMTLCKSLDIGERHARAVTRCAVEVERGRPVAATMGTAGLADFAAQRMLAAGERSGHFDHALEIVAERHAAAFETFVERATRLVEPLLLLTVATVVGAIVVLMYMPVFDLASSVG